MILLANPEIWLVCGSQHLYGPGPLKQVAADAEQIAAGLAKSKKLPLKTVFKALLTTPDEIAKLCLEANSDPNCAGLILWMHTFSPSKMWIRGLNVLQKPFAHLHTQFNAELPWDTIDMDFMNLNQSAHGDREAGFIHTRMRLARKVVVGHWADPEVHDRLGAWMRAARAWHDWQGGKFCRFGDNMRQVAVTEGDKVGAEMTFGFSTNGYGVGDLVAKINKVGDAAAARARRRIREELRGRSRTAQGRQAPRVAAVRRQAGARPARLPRGGRLQGLHRHVRGPARPQATARPRAAAADGRRLRLRRRGRLEDRRAGQGDEGDGRGPAGRHLVHGGLHLSLAARAAGRCSARTCSRSARASPAASRRSRSIRSASAARRIRCAWCSTPRRARRSTPASSISATASV